MSILTIILFFIYTYGLGYSVTYFLKKQESVLEKHLMRVGIGLGTLPLLIAILNLIKVPLDWRIFLVISLAVPVYSLIKNKGMKLEKITLTKSNIYALVALLLFALTLFMYVKGAFTYPYLEDEDPWGHSSDIKYIATEKEISEPIPGKSILVYAIPYPAGYDALMAILHQTSLDLVWTMKFFTALIVSLGIIFFYFFAKEFMDSRKKALIATLVLAMIPSYLSHFIWAHSLAVTLFFPALYCAEMIKHDKKWLFALSIVFAGMLTTQPTQPIKFAVILGFYWLIKSIYAKKFLKEIPAAFIIGLLLSLSWWGVYGTSMASLQQEGAAVFHERTSNTLFQKMMNFFIPEGGSATRAYTFSDYFIAKSQNLINNPVGLGIAISILLIMAIVIIASKYKSLTKIENAWITITLAWLVFTFLGMNSVTFHLPVGLFAFRFWMLFAIPVSLLAAYSITWLTDLMKTKELKAMLMVIIIILIFFTAAKQKYEVNTSYWYPGMWSPGELEGYMWVKEQIPANTPVFAIGDYTRITGVNKYTCFWCPEEYEFRQQGLNHSAQELKTFLTKNKYEYFVMGGTEARIYGLNETNIKINEIAASNLFTTVHQTTGVLVFKV